MTTTANTARTAAPPVAGDGAPGHARPAAATAGAALAAASRAAQGLPAAVSDPGVLARLRDLCAAPRRSSRTAGRV
ncbi:MAG: hypothetical protein LBL01_00860 [Bifidobacteriaceae bacterium]|nr:hypothetical protein [Bifidobacteriaceae bacterium]